MYFLYMEVDVRALSEEGSGPLIHSVSKNEEEPIIACIPIYCMSNQYDGLLMCGTLKRKDTKM